MNAAKADAETGMPEGTRRWAAFAVGLAVTMSVMDGIMLSVALPSIAQDLKAAPADAVWVVNAYQLAAALVLLPLGKLADIFGHRRIYLGCMALFTLASAGCAFSNDLVSLSICRFVQGCGGAGIMGITNAMLRFIYPPTLLARGISINSLVVALALAASPLLASVIVELSTWHWLFLVNIPIGALLLLVGLQTLPATAASGERFEVSSALLAMMTFGTIILAIDFKAHSESVLIPLALGVVGIASGVNLVRVQLKLRSPLFPVDLLRTRMFGLSVATLFLAAMAQVMAYVAIPFLLMHDFGRGQIETGLLFLPWPIALACVAPLSARLATRLATSHLCSIGLTIFAIGLISLATLGPYAPDGSITWRMAICGVGYGLFQPPSSRAIVTSAPIERSGSASVMGALSRVLGQTVGASIVAIVFRLAPNGSPSEALIIAAFIAGIAVCTSLARGKGE